MNSLRSRLILATLVGTSLTILLCGLPIYFLVRDRMLTAIDSALVADARASAPAILLELRSARRLTDRERTGSAPRDGERGERAQDRPFGQGPDGGPGDSAARPGLGAPSGDDAGHEPAPDAGRAAGLEEARPSDNGGWRRGRGRRGGRPPLPFAPVDDELTFQCRDASGTAVLASSNLKGINLPRLAESLEPLRLAEFDESLLRFTTLTLPNSETGAAAEARAVALRVLRGPSRRSPSRRGPGEERIPADPGRTDTPRGEQERAAAADTDGASTDGSSLDDSVEIVLVRDTSALGETLRYLASLLGAAWLIASLGAAGMLTFFVRRGLRPLDALRDQIAEVDEDRLEHVFEVPGAPLELAPVIGQMNFLVRRMRTSLEREHAFSANAAHELRTPLAGLRATLEVAADQADSLNEHVEAEQTCLRIVDQMHGMVETLLQLARSESTRAIEPRAVDLRALIESLWASRASAAAERELTLDLRLAETTLSTDRALLARLIDNLLENAINYADAGSTLTVAATDEPPTPGSRGHLHVRFTNAASDAPDDLAARGLDAFWRAESARSSTGQHAGLGLTLCERIASALGGSLALAYEQNRFTVELRLPN